MIQPDLYNLIRRPVVSEKTTGLSENNQIVFETEILATKPQIKRAVEAIFKVKVKTVNTMRVKGKQTRLRGFPGRRKHRKKAVVTLMDGQKIDLSTRI